MSQHLQHLPSLAVRVECSHCLEETDWDDGHYCPRCGIRFPEDLFSGDPGEFADEDADPCGAVAALPVEEYEHHGRNWKITRAACILPAGHESPHMYPETFESEEIQ